MKKAVWIWVVRVISLCVLGPLAGALVSSLRGADGSVHATPMVSGSLMSGLFVLFGVFFLAMIGGIIATKAVSLREGVLNSGLVVCWGAWGAGRVGETLRTVPESASLIKLSIEGLVVFALSFWILAILSRSKKADEFGDACVRFDRAVLSGMMLRLPLTLGLIGIGVVVSMVMVWLQVQSDLSGQAVWGGFIGAVISGVVGGMVIQNHNLSHGTASGTGQSKPRPLVTNRWMETISKLMVSVHKDKSDNEFLDVSLLTVMMGVMIGGVVGPLMAMILIGGGGLMEAIAAGDLPGFVMMSSFAWCGGALVGTPVGYSWVESSVARQHAQSHAAV